MWPGMCSACGMFVTQPGVALVRVPRLLRHLAAFVGVNQVVMRAEAASRLSRRPLRAARSLPSCARAAPWSTGSKPLSIARPSIDFASRSSGIRGDQLAQAGDVGGVGGVLRARRAARGLRLDVEPLARRHLVAQRHRLGDRFARADLRIDRRAVGRARDGRSALGSARRAASRAPPFAVSRSSWNAGR